MGIRGSLSLLVALALAAACGRDPVRRERAPGGARQGSTARANQGSTARADQGSTARADQAAYDAAIEHLAGDLVDRARALEPSVSRLMVGLAPAMGGRLAGLEHRLKERASLRRKIRKILVEHPERSPSDVVIDDALRYTLEVPDRPPGRYAEAVRATLGELEKAGHRVSKVKNYWPRGDSYAGINAVLLAPGGLLWELQFHTPDSLRVRTRDRPLYEEAREVTTSEERRRQLYFEMAALWDEVPIPSHMLEAKSIHVAEERVLRPPP